MPTGEHLKGKGGVKFGEGQDPTKGGAPKGKRITTILKEILNQDISKIGLKDVDLPNGVDGNKAIAIELLTIAFSKDHKDKLSAIKEILDRNEGKVTQPIENTIKGSTKIDEWLNAND